MKKKNKNILLLQVSIWSFVLSFIGYFDKNELSSPIFTSYHYLYNKDAFNISFYSNFWTVFERTSHFHLICLKNVLDSEKYNQSRFSHSWSCGSLPGHQLTRYFCVILENPCFMSGSSVPYVRNKQYHQQFQSKMNKFLWQIF